MTEKGHERYHGKALLLPGFYAKVPQTSKSGYPKPLRVSLELLVSFIS